MSHTCTVTMALARAHSHSQSARCDPLSLLDLHHPPIDFREETVDPRVVPEVFPAGDLTLVQVLSDGRDPLHQRVVPPPDRVRHLPTLRHGTRDSPLLLAEPLLQLD